MVGELLKGSGPVRWKDFEPNDRKKFWVISRMLTRTPKSDAD